MKADVLSKEAKEIWELPTWIGWNSMEMLEGTTMSTVIT